MESLPKSSGVYVYVDISTPLIFRALTLQIDGLDCNWGGDE